MNRTSIITIILINCFILFSCSKNENEEIPTTLTFVNESTDSYSSYFLFYYDSKGKCRLLIEGDSSLSASSIYSSNTSFIKLDYPIEKSLPKGIDVTKLYLMRDSIIRTNSTSSGFYRSFRLDTTIVIIPYTNHIIRIRDNIKGIEVDRQDPFQYPELIKDIYPIFLGPHI